MTPPTPPPATPPATPSGTPAGEGAGEPQQIPVPIRVAAVLTALEGLGFAAYGVVLLPELFGADPEAGSTASVFFLGYAAFLWVCARQLGRLRSWTRAPVVLAQLLQLLVGTGFWGGDTTLVALVLVALAVVVLATVLHPRSTAALGSG